MSRIKIKKITFISLLMFLIVTLIGCSKTSNLKFNEDNAYNHIKELSSDKYKGRLPGTEGHKKASEYIANEFEEIGLTPIGNKDKYFQKFKDYSPIIEGKPSFEVVGKTDNTIKEHSIRVDYAELPVNNTVGGLIEDKASIVKSIDDIENNKKIILSHKTFKNENDIKKLKDLGVNLLISPSKDDNKKGFLKSVITDGDTDDKEAKLIRILVKPNVFSELVNYTKEGHSIKFNMDLKVKKVDMRNVIGYIPAEDKDIEESLIISAHFDHVGYSPDGNVFNGALDNASGIGTLLEIARSIKESNISPKKNIVFVAFDGEEGGLKGSEYYASSRPFNLRESKIINLDMIGSKENVDLYIDYFPTSKASKDFAERIKNEFGEDLKLNPSASSDHAVFGDKDIPAVTLSHPSMKDIHTVDDDIDNIDKERLKEPGRLVLSAVGYYGIEAKDLIKTSISDTQDNNVYLLIVVLLFVIIIFLFLLRYRRKKGRPILTTTLLILIIFLILIFNSFYEYEDNGARRMLNTDKYRGKAWKDSEITSKVQNIYDSDFDENINILIDNDKNIEKLTINKKGELINRKELNIQSNSTKDIKTLNDEIYFIRNNSLSKVNINDEIETIKEGITQFDVIKKDNGAYIIASDDEKLYLIYDGYIKEIDIDGIKDIKAKMDNNENTHIIVQKNQDSGIEILYLYNNSNGELGELKSIAKADENTEIKFGIDVGKGYIFTNDKTNIKYGTFNLGLRSSIIKSFKELELTGNGGIKVDEDIGLIINDCLGKEGQLSLVAKGKDKYDVSYIFLRGLYNGKVSKSKEIYNKENIDIKDLEILNLNDYRYVFWMEGRGDNYKLKASASDPNFGNDENKVNLYIKLGNIIQNIFLMLLFFASRIYLILPGLIIIGIYKLLKKKDPKYLKIVILISIITNIIFQIILIKGENHIFGYSLEYIITPLILAIITTIIIYFYLKETNKSLIKTFIIFTLINMMLLSALYAPYSLKGEIEKNQYEEESLF